MIDAIIFSKNRACQLHLLLESIERFTNLFNNLFIIFYSDLEFEKGYNKIKEYSSKYNWIQQEDFKWNVLATVKKCSDYICFFVDDNFIHRSLLGSSCVDFVFSHYDIFTLSLRLGKNTIIQNWQTMQKTPMPSSIKSVADGDIFVWDWTKMPPHTNFGYPFSVDGHIYRKDMLLEKLTYDFDTPNAFEGRFPIQGISNKMACFGHSIIVNNPINLVGSSENWTCNQVSLEELEKKYLEGYTIDLDKLCKNEIIACHQGMKVEFK